MLPRPAGLLACPCLADTGCAKIISSPTTTPTSRKGFDTELAPARHLGSALRHLSVCWGPARAAVVWGRKRLCGSALLQVDTGLESQFSQHQHGFQTPQPWPLSLYTLQAVIIPLQKLMQTLEKENILQVLEQ